MPSHKIFSVKSHKNLIANLMVKHIAHHLGLALSMSFVAATPAVAQSVTPNNDGTGTIVNTDGKTINIDGGNLSGDGTNLFHSFEQFGLSESEIANFMSSPNIRNILGRINGGDPSIINGLIQVTGGNSNLLLMNPAGIIFGESAQLNVPADFTATTATGIGFEHNVWFNAVGENNYQALVGTPNTFAFDGDNSGVIVNGGKLKLTQGSELTFVAGNVINTGEIQATEGSVTLSAVPGSSRIKISQPGHLLSLEIEPPRDSQGQVLPFSAPDLPELLTSSGGVETGLIANDDGLINISDTGNSFFSEPGMTISSGEINVSGEIGGEVNITGNKVGLLSGDIDGRGTRVGGNVRLGGDYQGGKSLPQATQTIVDQGSTIAVDATKTGDGGEVVIWSDSLTRFTGNITARGGKQGGDGGLVEVSGKDLLVFTGTVDAESTLGKSGELLLDPKNIIIGDENTALVSIFSPSPENEQADIAGFGVSVATVGEDLLVGSPANVSGGENNAGQAFLFDRSGNALRTYDNPEPVQGGFFGFSVAAVGSDELLIGAPRNTFSLGEDVNFPEAGQVFLFNKTDSQPLETFNNPNPNAAFISQGRFTGAVPLADTNFGAAVTVVDSDRFLIGAPGHRVTSGETEFERSGQVFVIGRDGGTLHSIENPNPSRDGNGKGTGNSFGISVTALENERGAIGAPRNGDAGQAFVFTLNGTTPQVILDNPQTNGSQFGQSVAKVFGDRLAVGAPDNDDGGQVYVYDLNEGSEPGEILSNPESTGGDFGEAIAGGGTEQILVGAGSNREGVGQAFLFETGNPQPVATYNNPNSLGGGSFGTAVASLAEGGVLIGAAENDFLGLTNSGEAFVSFEGRVLDADSFTGAMDFDTDPEATFLISPDTIARIINTGTDVLLQASNDIIITTDQGIITNNSDGDGGNITFQAGRNITLNSDLISDNGDINLIANVSTLDGTVAEFRDPGIGTIEIAEGVTLDAGTGDLSLNIADGEGTRGNISLDNISGNNIALTTGMGTVEVAGSIDGTGDITVTGEEINFQGGANSITGQNITLSATDDQNINVGNLQNTNALDLTETDIAALNIASDAEGAITLSSASSRATVTLFDTVADGGITPLQNPVAILGGDTLVAPDVDLTWDIDSGNLDRIFANGLSYSNFENYQGGAGNNIFVLGNSAIASIDGGGGNNSLIGSNDNNIFNITGLNRGNVNEATEFTNIQNLIGGNGDDTFSFVGDTPELTGNIDGGDGSNQLDYEFLTSFDGEIFVFDLERGEATGINGTFTAIDNGVNIPDPTPIDPTPVDPTPVDPTPVDPTPIDPTPVEPTPIDPTPIDPTPIEPTPIDPTPVDPTPIDPTPIDPTPVEPTPIEPTPIEPTPIEPTPIEPTPEDSIPEDLETQVRNDLVNGEDEARARERDREIPAPEINNLALRQNSGSSELALLRRLDSNFTRDYENYFSRDLDGSQQTASAQLGVDLAEIQETLRTIEESTGAKPALIYASFFPAGIDPLQGRSSNILPQANDQLELVSITAEGKPIRKEIKGVTRADVDRSARRLTSSVAGLQPERLFLPHAQQLYQWLIEPLKVDLEAQEINNLVFLMDTGLRSLPVAALHDGEQYLIQEYSVGLMPSISLTDTRYRNINGVDLLAMGSETFPADSTLTELPAVPIEIDIITQQLWSGGSSFLDADFTIDNLKRTQKSQPFGILHLATHAEFNPGTPQNSYIQFGDRKLELDQVRELGLNNPQVELMVLSACKTAVGDRDAEFGFAGLAHQAGVKSALGSLWYISDEGTLSMMSKFYQELKEAPIKAEALRLAQVAMIEGGVRLEKGKLITANQTFELPSNIQAIDLTHPFFWSPYTIIGNPW